MRSSVYIAVRMQKGALVMNFTFLRGASILLIASVATLAAREPVPPPPAATVRARALGVPFDGTPGPLDAITDVAGVTVGYTTLISGEGKLEVGKGPVRTGVTAILPRGQES